jgi:hypothetical protein
MTRQGFRLDGVTRAALTLPRRNLPFSEEKGRYVQQIYAEYRGFIPDTQLRVGILVLQHWEQSILHPFLHPFLLQGDQV